MSVGELGSGWKNVEQYQATIRLLENRILEEIVDPGPDPEATVREIRVMIQLNEEFCTHSFRMNVAYDIEILCDLVERNLLDSEGR